MSVKQKAEEMLTGPTDGFKIEAAATGALSYCRRFSRMVFMISQLPVNTRAR